MKTTVEIPDSTFRRVKTLAAARGISLKQFFTEALDDKLASGSRKASQPPWMKGFGGLAALKAENARIMALVEEEFEQIEPEDRKRSRRKSEHESGASPWRNGRSIAE